MARVGQDTKQPADVLDYDIDFAEWMAPGDALDTVDTEVRLLGGPDTTPLKVLRTQLSARVVKVWVAEGASGGRYRVTVRATTVEGRVKEAELDIRVKEI